MATLSTVPNMSSKRLPLANNTNAINSPFRTVASLAGKRSRAYAADPRDAGQPPLKKQVLDLDHDRDENQQSRSLIRQSTSQQEQDAKLFLRKPGNAPPTAFERKLAAARKPVQRTADSLESIRQWQRHYRKAFPQFVFYFESVPDDVRSKVSRQIQYLGAVCSIHVTSTYTHTDPLGRKKKSSSRGPSPMWSRPALSLRRRRRQILKMGTLLILRTILIMALFAQSTLLSSIVLTNPA